MTYPTIDERRKLIDELYNELKPIREEQIRLEASGYDPKNCEECRKGTPVSHNGSARCRSGSIASGGHRAHCTCDTCW